MKFNTKVFTVQTCTRKKCYKIGVIKPFRWLTAKLSFNSFNVPVIFFVDISSASWSLDYQNYGSPVKKQQFILLFSSTCFSLKGHLQVQHKNYIYIYIYIYLNAVYMESIFRNLVVGIVMWVGYNILFVWNCEVSRCWFHVKCMYTGCPRRKGQYSGRS